MACISIITVTFNADESLEKTILSVISQSYKDFEFIIVDGKSSDGTMNIISKYSKSITQIISEEDKGIYDAMNKGIAVAKGRYLYFLGADDILANTDVLKNVSNYLNSDNLDLLVGNISYDTGKIFQSSFNFKTLLNNTIHHQGAFYNKNLYDNFSYDINLRLIADYELNLFIYLNKKRFRYKFIKDDISICSDGGASRKMLNLAFNETNTVREKLLGKKPILRWLYFIKFKISYAI
ncbi:glycosyl transferase family 2 [Pedobacter psychrotolerans]|uniref:Glycosyl transferase n=1 Tax=Pedobacter psychrotolerans TaxID=1843235 RepID=A0A4R2HEB3_9SPHI|nr:glycosyltransferase family 2 protein [Pedobacter psychrotolerans]TCO26681.1 glycosyl transferase family 2 [Pedobacter psychrotolerans]GGE55689.1 glycosyl transferase [Pedobacter psychrotolerans]